MRTNTARFLVVFALTTLAACTLSPLAPEVGHAGTAPTGVPEPVPADLGTPTSSPVPESVSTKCIVVQASRPDGFAASGKLIVVDYHSPQELYGLTLSQAGIARTAPFGRNISFPTPSVSPDRAMLAYVNTLGAGTPELNLVDSNDKIVKTIPWPDNWVSLVNWLNDTALAISSGQRTMLILNPSTGEQVNVKFEQFPGFNFAVKFPWMEYDPSLTRVIYPAGNQVLLNSKNMQRLAKIPDAISRAPDASWTGDGSHVAIVGSIYAGAQSIGDEIFVIDSNGTIEQVTKLADYYGAGVSLRSPRWSPDGKHLAFWKQDSSKNASDAKLEAVDIGSKQVTDYCLSSYPQTEGFGGNLPAPIWSPDGTQIMVENRLDAGHSSVVLLDVVKNLGLTIADDARPIGWMVDQP